MLCTILQRLPLILINIWLVQYMQLQYFSVHVTLNFGSDPLPLAGKSGNIETWENVVH
jgi:hypothetical protein